MKAVATLLFSASALLGCNSPSADQPQGSSSNDSEPTATETFTFSLDDLTVSVEHTNMEVSDECPKVLLLSGQGTIIDQQPLCKVDIEGYRSFDAREDFAFISFQNYRMDSNSLLYSIDLALLQGSAFIAECDLAVTAEQLSGPKCKKLAQQLDI